MIIFIMIVLHDDAHLLIFEIIEILWHKDSRFLDFSPQEQMIFLARNSALSPRFLRRYSIDAPSILHRWSIVSMEDRWRTDGLSMEYTQNFKEGFVILCPIFPAKGISSFHAQSYLRGRAMTRGLELP